MARKLNSEMRLARYRADVEGAQRETEDMRKDWSRYAKMYKGEQWELRDGTKITPKDAVAVNQIAPIINTILPSVTTQSPRLRVQPLRPQDYETAPLTEAVLNYEWRRLDVTYQLKLSALDMLIYGVGWLKVGYDYSEVEIPRDPDSVDAEVYQTLSEMQMSAMGTGGLDAPGGDMPTADGMEGTDPYSEFATPQPELDIPSEDHIRAVVPLTDMVPDKDDIFVERVSPVDVYVDCEAKTLEQARWIAHRMVKTVEEVQAHPLWKNTKNIRGTKTAGYLDEWIEQPVGLDQYCERVVIWEYYNLIDRKICVFADGHDKFLLEADYVYPFEHSPFVLMQDYLIPDELYGFGEVKLLEDLQIELNKTRTLMLAHNKRFNNKALYRPEAFGDEGVTALKSDKDGVYVPLTRGQRLDEAIFPLPAPTLPPDRYQIAQIISADIQQISGVSDYSRGSASMVRKSATEAAILQDAASLRTRDKLDRVERAATDVGRKMKALAQTYYDRERWVLITGNGKQVPVKFSSEDIQGEFDLNVDAGSTQPANEMAKMQQAERMYQMLRTDPLVKPEELLRDVLTAYGVKGVERYMAPPQQLPPPETEPPPDEGHNPNAPGTQPGHGAGAIPQPDEREQAAQAGQQIAGVPNVLGDSGPLTAQY